MIVIYNLDGIALHFLLYGIIYTNKAVTPAAKIELIVINFKTEIKVPFEAFPRTISLKASLTHKAKTCPPTTNETDKGMYK